MWYLLRLYNCFILEVGVMISLDQIQNSLSDAVDSAKILNTCVLINTPPESYTEELIQEINRDIMRRKVDRFTGNESLNKFCDTPEELVELNEYFESNEFPVPQHKLTKEEVMDNVLKSNPKIFTCVKIIFWIFFNKSKFRKFYSSMEIGNSFKFAYEELPCLG